MVICSNVFHTTKGSAVEKSDSLRTYYGLLSNQIKCVVDERARARAKKAVFIIIRVQRMHYNQFYLFPFPLGDRSTRVPRLHRRNTHTLTHTPVRRHVNVFLDYSVKA